MVPSWNYLGLLKKESFYAQQKASIPEKKFNEILDEGVRVTQEALLREARSQHLIENRPLAPLPRHKYPILTGRTKVVQRAGAAPNRVFEIVKCKQCSFKQIKNFALGDYVTKTLGLCTQCNTANLFIDGIYGEPPHRK